MKLVLVALGLLSAATFAIAPTAKRPVVNEYQNIKVIDDYQWLENAADPEVQKWTVAQDRAAKTFLEKLPKLSNIRSQLQKWNSVQSPDYRALIYAGGTYFASKLEPPKDQPLMVAFSDAMNRQDEKVVVDPNQIDASGKTSIDFFTPSVDGKLLAVSLSVAGSEEGTLHFFDVKTGQSLPDQIERVNKPTAGGSAAWNQQGDGIFYTRYPEKGERPEPDLNFYQQIYFHKLGTSQKEDTYSFGKDFPRIAETHLDMSSDGAFILASVANGDGGEFAHYLLGPNQQWIQITRFEDKVIDARFGVNKDLYLLSRAHSPRGELLKLNLNQPKLALAKTLIPASDAVIRQFVLTADRLYLEDLVGGPSQLRVFETEGKFLGTVALAPLSSVSSLIRAQGDQLFFKAQTYTTPSAWYQLRGLIPKKTSMVVKSVVDMSDIEIKREYAVSRDGVKVPINILARRGLKLNGKNPTLLTGYGGYGISITPSFKQDTFIWLRHGGVIAEVNLRGGGEFGEEWQRAGNLDRKQTVFSDFIAAAEYLIQREYTSASRLAIEGRSNGGLLMGAVLTQRPDLFRAVVSHVGIYDMLRVELDANGAFNVTEFGTVKDPKQFKALYDYSPYHHVVDKTPYPSVLLLTGANDGRVNPSQSKKMEARLQAATSSKNPILLRVDFEGGHGVGKGLNRRINEEAEVYAFLFSQLGMTF